MDALACEEILAEAAVRIRAVGSHAAEQVERIRAEVKAITGFEQLRGMAVYGAEARALILKAIEALH